MVKRDSRRTMSKARTTMRELLPAAAAAGTAALAVVLVVGPTTSDLGRRIPGGVVDGPIGLTAPATTTGEGAGITVRLQPRPPTNRGAVANEMPLALVTSPLGGVQLDSVLSRDPVFSGSAAKAGPVGGSGEGRGGAIALVPVSPVSELVTPAPASVVAGPEAAISPPPSLVEAPAPPVVTVSNKRSSKGLKTPKSSPVVSGPAASPVASQGDTQDSRGKAGGQDASKPEVTAKPEVPAKPEPHASLQGNSRDSGPGHEKADGRSEKRADASDSEARSDTEPDRQPYR